MTQNYIVSSETGIEVNGTVYETGHVLDLNEEQVNSDPFSAFIADGSLTLEPTSETATAPAEESTEEAPKDEAAGDASGTASQDAATDSAPAGDQG